MTEEKKKVQKAPQKSGGVYAGKALLVTLTVLISVLFTSGIAYGVQNVVGGGGPPDEGVLVDGVKEFEIKAEQWVYHPAALKVDPGDRIRFVVTSQDIMHGFSINELGVNLALNPDVGIVREVMIPVDMPEGTYTMYCSIFCGIGHPYMKGIILIGEPSFEIGKVLPYVATVIMAGMFAIFVVIGGRRER
ncbi:MAG: hypothetical protein QGG15_00190 [Dehalococcoidales bacterium]|nr:hypothetical protein [Dehalococcoidales bacterium]MDP6737447.1 hypothetical protein [Dehalococcoidales bacterium]